MANTVIGNLIYKIVGDSSKLDKDLKKSNKEVKGLGKSLGNLGKILKGGAVAGAIIFAAKKVFDLGKVLVNASSDAEETQNKFDVVFSSIKDEADAAAKNLQENFGLSGRAAQSLLGDTADLLSGFGFTQTASLDLSNQVNELAVDLASFTNFSGGAEGASQALTKALLGERESVKALGISILDADVKAKVLELTQRGLRFETERQAKAYATLELATEQSKNSLGDFQRSIGSFANQSRIASAATEDLKVSVGELLLPAVASSVTAIANLTKGLQEFIDTRKELASADKAVAEGVATSAQKILTLESDISELRKLSTSENASQIQIVIQAKQREIIGLSTAIELEKERIRILKEQTDAEAFLSKKQEEAGNLLADRQAARKTDDENQLDFLNNLIKEWAQFREVAGVQELLNDLIAERTELLEKQAEAASELTEEEEEAAKARIAESEKIEEALRSQETNIAIIRAQNRAKDIKEAEEAAKEKERIERELAANIKQIYSDVSNLIQAVFDQRVTNAEAEAETFEAINGEEIAQLEAKALTEEGLTAAEKIRLDDLNEQKKELAQEQYERELAAFKANKAFQIASTIITGAAAAINAFNALAVIPIVGPVLGGIAAGAVGVLTAVQVGLIASQQPPPAPSFENGGIVPGTSTTGDNVKANVNSKEMILTQEQQARLFNLANGGSTGGAQTIIVNLGKEAIFKAVNSGTKTGKLIIDARSVK
jgi:hypothetical protein